MKEDRAIVCLLLVLLGSSLAARADRLPFLGAEAPQYDIALTIDSAWTSFTGVEEVEFVNTTGTRLEEVFLRLYPNAPSLYGNGTLRVEEVRVGGASAETEILADGTVLGVFLPSLVEEDQVVRLALTFSGRPAAWGEEFTGASQVGYGIFASSKRAMTLASFYPILALYDEGRWEIDPVGEVGDPVSSAAASYAVRVSAPCDSSILASGRLTTWEMSDGECSASFSGEGMRDFMMVIGRDYREVVEDVDGVTLRAAFFPEHALAQETALVRARAALSIYAESFGPCAYDELDLVEVPLERAAGVEYPGLILVGEGYCANPEDPFFDVIIAHEVAHQWWYAAVGNDVVKEPWLDEGLATFSSGLFLEEAFGKEAARQAIARWEDSYRAARAEHPELSVASPVDLFPDAGTYSAFVYSGGALLFHELRQVLGDTLFFSALSSYYREEAFGVAHGSDLLAQFVRLAPRDLSGIFAEYLGPQGTGSSASAR